MEAGRGRRSLRLSPELLVEGAPLPTWPVGVLQELRADCEADDGDGEVDGDGEALSEAE